MSQEAKIASTWKARWREAIDGSAGIAPYLDEGAEYVEEIRRQDAGQRAR